MKLWLHSIKYGIILFCHSIFTPKKFIRQMTDLYNPSFYYNQNSEFGLYQCPYCEGTKCDLTENCLECETFGKYLNKNKGN